MFLKWFNLYKQLVYQTEKKTEITTKRNKLQNFKNYSIKKRKKAVSKYF